jgi:aminoglycoside phosphotransferase (APT) family kinase protein
LNARIENSILRFTSMTDSETQKFAHLVQTVAPQSTLLRVWPLQGGISAQMTALELQEPDGRTYRWIVRRPGAGALRRNPQAAAHEFKLLQAAQTLGLAAPKPLYLDQSGALFGAPCLVIEYIEGKPEFNPTSGADFTGQLAGHLARIHRVDGEHPGLAFLPKAATGCAETSGAQPATADESFDEGRIRAALAAAWPLPSRNPPVLLHGDYWPGNVLWREGRLVAVVDWEDAKSGDPLIDLAISRLDILWIFGVEAMHAFTRHYRSLMALDYTGLPYWDLCAALRLVRLAGADLAGWAAFYPPYGRHDITEQTIRQHYRFFITQALAHLSASAAIRG